MAENTNNTNNAAPAQELNELLQIRRDKLKGGSSGEYWAMGESLTQRRRVREEDLRIVNLSQQGRRK